MAVAPACHRDLAPRVELPEGARRSAPLSAPDSVGRLLKRKRPQRKPRAHCKCLCRTPSKRELFAFWQSLAFQNLTNAALVHVQPGRNPALDLTFPVVKPDLDRVIHGEFMRRRANALSHIKFPLYGPEHVDRSPSAPKMRVSSRRPQPVQGLADGDTEAGAATPAFPRQSLWLSSIAQLTFVLPRVKHPQ